MMMRKRPVRGEILLTTSGEAVTVLEAAGESSVKVILPTEKITVIAKNDLNLPIIDTKAYEKMG